MGADAGRDHAGAGQPTEAHDVHRPASVVLAPRGHHLGAAGEGGESLGAGRGPQERAEPVAVHAGLLEPLVGRESVHPGVDRLDHVVGAAQDGVAQLPHHDGVRRRVRCCRRRARGSDPSRPARRAARDGSRPSRSEHCRTGNVSWSAARQRSAVLRRRERAEVVGLVAEDPPHQRETGPRLPGQLDEVHLLGEAGPPVVARLVLGDQAQLPDLGLERGRALDPGDGGGQVDHLAHPRAGLGGGEVGADAGAQVPRRADVEHPGPVVAEEVDAGRVGEPLGEVPLASLGRADPRRERRQLLQGVHAETAEPLHQAVQDVHRGSGVGQGPVVGCGGGVEQHRERGELAVGGVVPGDHPTGQLGRVDDLERRPWPALLRREVLEEARRRTARCGPPAHSPGRTPGTTEARTRWRERRRPSCW